VGTPTRTCIANGIITVSPITVTCLASIMAGFLRLGLTPWGAPVAYGWGGGFVAPWFGFYAGYFTPYGTYASPDLWLTDYLIGQNLRLAYESQQAGNADQAPQPSDARNRMPPTCRRR